MASSLKDTPLYLSNWALADVDSGGSAGTDLNTGVLRRKYNFGDQVSELAISQTAVSAKTYTFDKSSKAAATAVPPSVPVIVSTKPPLVSAL